MPIAAYMDSKLVHGTMTQETLFVAWILVEANHPLQVGPLVKPKVATRCLMLETLQYLKGRERFLGCEIRKHCCNAQLVLR